MTVVRRDRDDGSPVGSGRTRPLLPSRWRVPADVVLDGDRLVWRYSDADTEVRADPSMLRGFQRLVDGRPEQIARYARRWGVLEICEHDRPTSHWLSEPEPGLPCIPNPVSDSEGAYWESLATWRRYAGAARGIWSLAGALRRLDRGDADEWRAIPDLERFLRAAHSIESDDTPTNAELATRLLDDDPAFRRRVHGFAVDEWLRLGAVRPSFRWDGERARVELGGWGLFGALGVQLMQAVSRVKGLAICSACGTSYFPAKQPHPNRAHYCPECGIRAAWRAATSRYRRKDPPAQA